MQEHTTIAVDVAKNVFEVAISREAGRVCERQRLSRGQMERFFANQPAGTVLLEACGTAHHWGRVLGSQGHEVRLLPPGYVRRYRLRDKTDQTDARALLEAHRNEQIVPVPVKTVAQQTVASVHRMRSAWMTTRTARINALRGILRELGIYLPVGASRVLPKLSELLAEGRIPPPLHPLLLAWAAEIRQLEKNIHDAERQLRELSRGLPATAKLLTVPGIGLLTATALIASIGEPTRFRSARRMAAFLGLVPREHSSGSRRSLGAITKRGDPYLRTLLTHGARSVLRAAKVRRSNDRLAQWALRLQERRGHNRAAIALANKLARIAWAVWTRDAAYTCEARREPA